MAWTLCDLEQQSRSNTTNAINATNVTHHQATYKTSSIKPVHAFGLLALNPGQSSTSSSPFYTPSVADSVESAEFTETNPAGVIDKQAPEKDQQAPGNSAMPDTADESEMHEISTGAASSVQMQQVCQLFEFLKSEKFSFHKPK